MNEILIIVLVMIGSIVLLLILAYVGSLLTPIEITFPGIEVDKKPPDEAHAVLVVSNQLPSVSDGVSLVTDGVSSEAIDNGRWRLHLFLSFFNYGHSAVILYDLHAHVYCRMAYILPPASILWRAWIEIYETNSILAGGKEFHINPNECESMELVLEISRFEGISDASPATDGMVLALFGLFADYHTLGSRGVVPHRRIPSESVFSFQNSDAGHLVYVNSDNISKYWDKHKSNPNGRKLVNAFRKVLEKHTSQIFELERSSDNNG